MVEYPGIGVLSALQKLKAKEAEYWYGEDQSASSNVNTDRAVADRVTDQTEAPKLLLSSRHQGHSWLNKQSAGSRELRYSGACCRLVGWLLVV